MRQHHRSFRLTPPSALPVTAGDAASPTLISSASTSYYKRTFPIIWFGFIAFFLCATLGIGISQKQSLVEFVPFIVVPLLLAAFGYGLMKRNVFDLVDEVWDAGSDLIVKNKDQEDRIALKDVVNVNYDRSNPSRVTLMLREPSAFGSEISFAPPYRFFFWSMPPIARDLIARIDATRIQSSE
jgi:hypothetical protein